MRIDLILLACAIEACCIYLASLGNLRSQVLQFWTGFFPAFFCYALAAWLVLRRADGSTYFILGAALLFRLTLWWSPATLSDDIFRYVWDGQVQLAGINPYLYPPSAPEVAHLREALWQSVNHADISTVYPPLAQIFFRAVCTLNPTPAAMKLALLLCDWGLCLLLARSLVRRGQDPRRVLLYAWNPLPLIEVAGSGHIDALGILLLFLALHALQLRHLTTAVCALTAAFLAKLFPLILVPTFWRRAGDRTLSAWLDPRPRKALLLFPLVVLVAFLPFADAGTQLIAGLRIYIQHWYFNAAAYSLIHYSLSPWDGNAHLHARWFCTAFFVFFGLYTQIRSRDPYHATFIALGAYVLLSPTMHPWYLLWVLPFLPFFPHPAWLLFSGLIVLAYEVLMDYVHTGVWQEKTWVLWAQYAPLYIGLIATAYYRRFIKSNESAPSDV
ncbi:MAG: hypothetical protein VX893_15620 [Candidatus Latescibacterota bacterium]|nr:hypothetical protein [Candidatus Latescibacterota bacterium]